jgi:hypothetical protein
MTTLGQILETLAVLIAGGYGFCLGLWKFTLTSVLLTANEVLDVWKR